MNLGDYLLPWKAIPNMIKDVKEVAKPSGKNKHGSIVGALGKYGDVAGMLLGDKWMNFVHERIPEQVNETLQPVNHMLNKVDPIRMFAPEDSKLQKLPDFVENKGGDSLAAALAAAFGAAALFGGGGAAAAGGGTPMTGSPAPTSSGGMFDFGSYDWTDPNTYIKMSKMMPRQQQGMMQQQPSNQMYMNAQAQQGPMTLQDLLRVYGLEPYSNS